MPALIVLTDLQAPAPDRDVERMPALERMLARADFVGRVTGDWREWVQLALGVPLAAEPLPLANVARGEPGHWAFATPVHLLAGLESLHLHPAVPLVLDAGERRELAGGFATAFGPEHALEFDADGVGYLRLERPVDAVTHDPARVAGRIVGGWLPSGSGAAALARLATEIQMWLHELPLNAARERRGELAVNALWLWGVSRAAMPSVSVSLPALWSEDPYLAGLWRLAGAARAGVPGRSAGWQQALAGDEPVITLSLAGQCTAPGAFDDLWCTALERSVARGRHRARLWVAGREYQLGAASRFRFWRRPRPWHEVLVA